MKPIANSMLAFIILAAEGQAIGATYLRQKQQIANTEPRTIERLVDKPKWNFELLDADGSKHSPQQWRSAPFVVLFFLAVDCPISNRYSPEINRIVAEYGARGALFYGVYSDPATDAGTARRHAREYGYRMPMLLDPMQMLASRTGVKMTPTSVILSPRLTEGDPLYRGRIDDRYLDFGRFRDTGVKSDLRPALEAALAGATIPNPITKGVGCALPPPGRR